MSQDTINGDVLDAPMPPKEGRRVAQKNTAQTKSSVIMEVAEHIRPTLIKMLQGKHGEDGLLLQPSHIRGIALNVAQQMVNDYERKLTLAAQ